MDLGTISQLPKETTSLIASTQIITSVSTAVKELVENSLDAGAKNILVKLKNYGLDSIEVKDDGYGISCENVHKMFLAGYTSKISGFEDLDKLCSYGFRGEALAALCRVANVTITTKSNSDILAMTYTIDPNGIPVSSKPSHITKGTIITINNLFGNLPVRKQYLSSKKRLGEELKKVEQIIQQLAVIKPDLRMSLVHNGCNIFQKNSLKELKQSFMQVIGLKLASQMEYLCETTEKIIIDLIIPKKNLENVENLLSSSNSMFIYVNGRPIVYKNITKILMEYIFLNFNLESSNKTCLALISLNIPPNELDINLEPNKTRLLLKNEKKIIKILDDLLSTFYQQKIQREEPDKNEENVSDEDEEINTQPKRPRLDPVENLMALQSREEEFREKNNGWGIEIIGDIEPITEKPKTSVKTICSQINSDNCILTTDKEVSELNDVLKDNSQGGVSKFNSEIKYIVDPKLTSLEKKILPDWPVRNLPEKSPVKFRSALFESEEWSKGNLEMEKGILEGGARLLLPEAKEMNAILNEVEKSMPEVRQLALGNESSSEVDKIVQNKPFQQPSVIEMLKNETAPKIVEILQKEKNSLYAEVKEKSQETTPKPEKKQTVLPAIFQMKKTEKQNLQSETPENSNKKENKKKIKKKPIRKEILTKISLQKISTLKNLKLNDPDGIKLLGQLKPSGNWLYLKDTEIGHVRHSGLQELIISQKMLANHCVPLKDCDKPIFINENILGKEYWDVLISLESGFDTMSSRYVVKEDAIRMNGFKIEMEKEEETGMVVRGLITQVASTIPHYGIGELRDVLALYLKHGECGGLAKWRTTPLWNYISNESIRISQQSPRLVEREEIQNLIDTWQSYLNHIEPKCLHSKDIFVPIYQLENLSSQTINLSQY